MFNEQVHLCKPALVLCLNGFIQHSTIFDDVCLYISFFPFLSEVMHPTRIDWTGLLISNQVKLFGRMVIFVLCPKELYHCPFSAL
jgi:hypothetical protein